LSLSLDLGLSVCPLSPFVGCREELEEGKQRDESEERKPKDKTGSFLSLLFLPAVIINNYHKNNQEGAKSGEGKTNIETINDGQFDKR